MLYEFAAEIVLLIHFAFVVFVVLGALLALRWPWAAVFHIPLAAWGAATEFFGIVCPLTPLEQQLLRLAGEAGYSGEFIDHYLARILYPEGLTRSRQLVLGAAAVGINVVLYACVLLRRGRRARRSAGV
jgi:hypothetical protein